jgi:Rhodopirellula transposase DDE domain
VGRAVVCGQRGACGGTRRNSGRLRRCPQHDRPWSETAGSARASPSARPHPPYWRGGRKAAVVKQPGLVEALTKLIQSAIRGGPEAALLWVSKSQRHLAKAWAEQGYNAGYKVAGRLLRGLGFSLQANAKTREGGADPEQTAFCGPWRGIQAAIEMPTPIEPYYVFISLAAMSSSASFASSLPS